jgi:hypothetical protein
MIIFISLGCHGDPLKQQMWKYPVTAEHIVVLEVNLANIPSHFLGSEV